MKARIARDVRRFDINDEDQASVNPNVHSGGVGDFCDVALWPDHRSSQRGITATRPEPAPAKTGSDAKETSH